MRSTGIWIKKIEFPQKVAWRGHTRAREGGSVSEYMVDGGETCSRLFGRRLVVGVAAQKARDLLSLKSNFDS